VAIPAAIFSPVGIVRDGMASNVIVQLQPGDQRAVANGITRVIAERRMAGLSDLARHAAALDCRGIGRLLGVKDSAGQDDVFKTCQANHALAPS
jgi:hypothetical protein